MQIIVKKFLLTGYKTVMVEVEPSDLVFDVKIKIQQKINLSQHLLSYRKKLLDDDKSLTFYNVLKDSTLELLPKLFSYSACSIEMKKDIKSREELVNYACQKFQEKLLQSRNKEVEVKTEAFKKLEEQKVELDKKMTKLEIKRYTNRTEYEDRNGCAKQEIKIMDQGIEKAKIALQKCQNDLAMKETFKENATKRQLLDSRKTDSIDNQIKQDMNTLEKKKIKIEKEQEALPKKQNVNEGLIEHISNMIDDKNKDLECPVCFETAKTPIYQCTGGHLICKTCLPNLRICPECRIRYPNTLFRNRFAEKMYEEIKKLSKERKTLLDEI